MLGGITCKVFIEGQTWVARHTVQQKLLIAGILGLFVAFLLLVMRAFSDGVIAINITIMVLELKVPHTTDFQSLIPLLPVFLSYALSFIYAGIYWNNHHHLFHAAEIVNG